MKSTVITDEEMCTGCGKCVEMCPKQILYIDDVDDVCKVMD